jgi:uncharacterized tellurite resistance protein B-like protein
MMEYFYTLSEKDKDMAMEQKANELLDEWLDAYIQENGDELPNLAEEGLLYELDKMNGTTHLEEAKKYYAQLEKKEAL